MRRLLPQADHVDLFARHQSENIALRDWNTCLPGKFGRHGTKRHQALAERGPSTGAAQPRTDLRNRADHRGERQACGRVPKALVTGKTRSALSATTRRNKCAPGAVGTDGCLQRNNESGAYWCARSMPPLSARASVFRVPDACASMRGLWPGLFLCGSGRWARLLFDVHRGVPRAGFRFVAPTRLQPAILASCRDHAAAHSWRVRLAAPAAQGLARLLSVFSQSPRGFD